MNWNSSGITARCLTNPTVCQKMKNAATAVIVIALICWGCERRNSSHSNGENHSGEILKTTISSRELLRLKLPALDAKGLKLIEILNNLNKQVSEAVDGDSRGEIVIVRNHPKIDNGEKVVTVNLSAAMLDERLNNLGAMTFTHWTILENDYLVFRTWHRSQIDFDDLGDDGLIPKTNRRTRRVAPIGHKLFNFISTSLRSRRWAHIKHCARK